MYHVVQFFTKQGQRKEKVIVSLLLVKSLKRLRKEHCRIVGIRSQVARQPFSN